MSKVVDKAGHEPVRALTNQKIPKSPLWLKRLGGRIRQVCRVRGLTQTDVAEPNLKSNWRGNPCGALINRWRRDVLGLKPVPFGGPQGLLQRQRFYGYSPLALPSAIGLGSGSMSRATGFLDRPADWQPPAALAEFIEAGPSPVYVGFGSMITRETETATRAKDNRKL